MPSNGHHGFASLIFGAIAIPIEAAVPYLRSVQDYREAVFLRWLGNLGLVRPGVPGSLHEFKPSPLITWTDEFALQFLQVFGIYLAVAALLFGLWAEYKRESSLLLSGGLLCACLALMLFHAGAGFSAMAACAIFGTALRRRTDA